MMKNILLLVPAIMLLTTCEKEIENSNLFGTHQSIAYIGRFANQSGEGIEFMYSGCALRTNFTGTSIKLYLDDDSVRNYFNVIIDGKLTVLYTDNTDDTYLLASELEDKVHELEIFRRTEWLAGNTTFLGFEVDEGATLIAPPMKSHKIEFIGDSYICGYGNEGANAAEGFKYETENSYMSYGAISARALDAEYISICYSGMGMVQDYKGNTEFSMVNYYDKVIHHSSKKWDYSEFTPELVVIGLGGNDVESGVDRDVFVNTYVNFLQRVRKNYGQATIICVAGPSSPNDLWPQIQDYVHAAVDDFKLSDDNIHYFEFTPFVPSGSNLHPNVAEHEMLAQEITPFIRQVMGW